MRLRWLVVLCAAGLLTAGCESTKEAGKPLEKKEVHGMKWGYKGEIGPDRWGDLSPEYKLCKIGKAQSPIDIRETKKAKLPEIEFHYADTRLNVVNNGHTIQVNYEPGSYIVYEGKKCELLQFHFHTPSEHLFNGKAFPMEVHLVHKCEDDGLLVIGVMMDEGKAHDLIAKIWEVMPSEEGEVTRDDVKINAMDLLPESRGYYTYPGSLTTPPCTEGVKWIMMKEKIEVSKDQIDRFRSFYDMNARPVQPLNDRVVMESE